MWYHPKWPAAVVEYDKVNQASANESPTSRTPASRTPASRTAGEPNTGEPNAGEPNTGEPNAGEANAGEPNAVRRVGLFGCRFFWTTTGRLRGSARQAPWKESWIKSKSPRRTYVWRGPI